MKKIVLIAVVCAVSSIESFSYSQTSVALSTKKIETLEQEIYNAKLSAKRKKQIFNEVKLLAENEIAEARCLLGILYKDGVGTKLNFNKAMEQFLLAYELGSEKAAYSLGYLYLKGLGNIPQDYEKAIHWFKKSEYPMAKHWLAKCNYYGYGMEVNKEIAMMLLRNNPIENSVNLLASWENDLNTAEDSVNHSTTIGNLTDAISFLPKNHEAINLNSENKPTIGISGRWRGDLRFMDWSSKMLLNTIPVEVEISGSSFGSIFKLRIENQEFSGEVLLNGNELIFPELVIPIKEKYVDHPSDSILNYQLTSLEFNLGSEDNVQYLNGSLYANILNWSEPSQPIELNLNRVGLNLSQEIIDAFLQQTEHFIKVYPNPFEDNLMLHYTLKQDAEVAIQLFDYYQPTKILKQFHKKQLMGERDVTLDNLNYLTKGLYLVNLNTGSENYTRIVIKN